MFVLPTHLFAVLQFCLAPCLSRLESVSGCCDVDEGLTWQVLCWWSGVRRYIEPEKILKERQTFDITHQASLTVCGFIQSYQQHRTPSQTNTQWHAQWHPHKKSTRSTTALREGRVVSSGVPQQVSICVLRARKQSGVIFPCMLAAYWIHAIFFSAHVYICLHVNMSASESLKFYTYKKCFLYKCACCHHKTVLCDFEKLRAKKKKKKAHLEWSCGKISDHTAPIIATAHIILMFSQQGFGRKQPHCTKTFIFIMWRTGTFFPNCN